MRIVKGVKGVFVDCGAHIGKYTILAARTADKVIAIEPHPDNYMILRRNVALNGCKNVVLLNHAIWNTSATFQMNYGNNNSEHSMKVDYKAGSFTVDALTLDNLGLERIDWLKLDIEGAEFEALQGAERMLSEKRMKNIIIELHDPTKVGDSAQHIRSLLEKNGFEIKQIKNYFIARSGKCATQG